MSVVDRSYDHPMKPEERAAAPLAGGIVMHGYQCGMLWGAALAAGAQAYRELGPGPKAETAALTTAQRLVNSFRAQTKGEINCSEITEMNWQEINQVLPILKFFVKGGPVGCFLMAARYARDAFEQIDATLSDHHFEAPFSPVSCAAVLARKMGASDLHATMAAGFAGGIGLSGGGCGALGAAIWIQNIRSSGEEGGSFGFENPQAQATIERFLESSDYEFECAEIVGRKFEDTADHAEYLHAGGCSGILEALAEPD